MKSKRSVFRILRKWIGDRSQYLRVGLLRLAGVQIGSKTFISYGAWIDVSRGKVQIGNNCEITRGCKILSHSAVDKRLHPEVAWVSGETVIGNNVFIGMNSIILSNINIGDHSVVGAGSVVTKSVPPFSVVAGNPARVIKQFDETTRTWQRVTGIQK